VVIQAYLGNAVHNPRRAVRQGEYERPFRKTRHDLKRQQELSRLAKCFHVELAESPSRRKLVIWSRDIGTAAHSATIRWKHIA
jgi:hypothetical protein